jgi:hypothetical protein
MSVTRRSFEPKRRWTSMSVKAGVLAGSTYPADEYRNAKTGKMVLDARAGMPTAVIAAALNYGSGQRVARPFMNLTALEQGKSWTRALRTFLKDGMSTSGAFATVGQIMKEDIQHTISTWPGDNSAAWSAIKGFDHGLLQTSHLLNSIAFEVKGGQPGGEATAS